MMRTRDQEIIDAFTGISLLGLREGRTTQITIEVEDELFTIAVAPHQNAKFAHDRSLDQISIDGNWYGNRWEGVHALEIMLGIRESTDAYIDRHAIVKRDEISARILG